MLKWITDKFTNYKPNRAIAIRAMRHLSLLDRRNLFSEDIKLMRTAEGYWFESLIYDQLLKISNDCDEIKLIVRKGADVIKYKLHNKIKVNGLYSADRGGIRVCGNRQDLAEVDMLLLNNKNQVVFCEMITSSADLKEFEDEIIYKKYLFGYMFQQKDVGFILFSSVDIKNTNFVKWLVSDPNNAYIETRTCEEMKSVLQPLRLVRSISKIQVDNPKLISCESLPTQKFNYKKLHDMALSKLFLAIKYN
ncbi:MAG TPA: hypothetical protein O0X14_02880, partial [Methanocorpusculum sp.]|nr:hypothetical protein [Methanocorpusculum sp.]